MICREIENKVDEKVFHFLYAHIFGYPEVLEKFIEDFFPDILMELQGREYDVRLNSKNVDLEISFGNDVGLYFEFKTMFWKTDEAFRQLDNYETWARHKRIVGVVVIPSEKAMDFIRSKKIIPQGRKVVTMEKLNEYAQGLLPAYLLDSVKHALQYLPKWRVEPAV